MEAGLRALYYVGGSTGWVDDRGFNFVQRLRLESDLDAHALSFGDFKRAVREQAGIMRRDPAAAIAALPKMLARIDADDLAKFGDTIERLLTLGGPLDAAAQERLLEIRRMVDDALHPAGSTAEAASSGGRGQRALRRGRAASTGP